MVANIISTESDSHGKIMGIIIRSENKKSISKENYNNLLKLRYQVFKERLNWDIETEFELESDDYDTSDVQYLYANDENMNICGCWRILPTTGAYMLKDTFPELLGDNDAPVSNTIYELSRFAFDKESAPLNADGVNISMEMFKSVYIYAIENGIEEYVTVTSTAVERMIKRIGIPSTRIGNKKVTMLGDTKSVALRIPINEQFKKSVLS